MAREGIGGGRGVVEEEAEGLDGGSQRIGSTCHKQSPNLIAKRSRLDLAAGTFTATIMDGHTNYSLLFGRN